METEAYKFPAQEIPKEAIGINDVSFSYAPHENVGHKVLQGISFTIPYRQIVGLVGRNASGKTTLIQIIRGLLVPQKGIVRVDGEVISADNHLRCMPKVAIISQKPDASLAPTMTVYENYVISHREAYSSLRWAYSDQRKAHCRRLLSLAEMELDTKLDEQVRFLSGGQQQALAILLALESLSLILLMDEPTGALDPFAANKVLDLAVSQVQQRNGTLLLVSHRLRDVIERCQRILVLNTGVVSEDLSNEIERPKETEILEMMSENHN